MTEWRDVFNEPGEVLEIETLGVATTDSELRRLYVREEKSVGYIADELGVSYSSAHRLMKRAGIERRDTTDPYKNKKYRNEDWLREQFVENGRSPKDIANECGVVYPTINNWIAEFQLRDEITETCKFRLAGRPCDKDYPVWTHTGDDLNTAVRVHRLAVIADGADPYKVYGDNNYNIHHRNGFKCDSRPENLELVDSSTHGRYHSPDDQKWTDDDIQYAIRAMLNPAEYIEQDA